MELSRHCNKTVKPEKSKLAFALFFRIFASPLFMLLYIGAWYFVCRMCSFYSSARLSLALLSLCCLGMLLMLILYFVSMNKYKKNSVGMIYKNIDIEHGNITLFRYSDVINILKLGRCYYVFLKGHRFIQLDLREMPEEKYDFVSLKLKSLNPIKKNIFALPVLIIIVASTVLGCFGVIHYGSNFNGRLAWYIFDAKQKP